ncbi:hypothetical protein KR093_001486 [Drosophila rubida]|uniref:Larval cuticle protein 65Ag1-like n=1 Tax=Drosophila rubida TaxID=30044 RepID=A0AAD4JXK1_9MUSC|nr:hypothetical protein KR093_001486 [Drosophila rubida]
MKFLIVFVALFAVALAAPPTKQINIVYLKSDVNVDGFNYGVETDDGTKISANGQLKQVGDEQGIAVKGSYAFVDTDGQLHELSYVADENGFQPQSADLPVAPVA